MGFNEWRRENIMKQMMRKMLALFMVMALLVGCSSSGGASSEEISTTAETQEGSAAGENTAAVDTAEESADEPLKLGISLQNMTNMFFIQIKDKIEASMGPNDEVIITDANGDQNKQLNDVSDMLNSGCNVIGICPINSEGVRATLEMCQEAGVPVICFSNRAADSIDHLVSCTVVSDNEECGRLCARALGEALNGEGKVVEITFSTTTASYLRQQGFEDEIATKYPGIEILQWKDMEKATADYSQPIMVDFINSYPDLDGVFTICDPAARGIIAALKEADMLDDVQVVSVDGSIEGKEFIRNGEMLASAAQKPDLIGETVAEMAYKLLRGEEVQKDIIITVEIIDATNVDSAE